MRSILGLGLALFALAITGCTSHNAAYSAGKACGADPMMCGGGTSCDTQAAICTCPAGSALCGQSCAVLATDAANCGGCGLACPSGQTCNAGRCSGGGCPTGAIDCNGSCVDPLTNAQSCGGCVGTGLAGRACGNGQACLAGQCVAASCPFGATACNGACVDLTSSATNCGACGHACGSGQFCSQGQCTSACAPGLTMCGSSCVDLKHDPTNCGACGTVCDASNVCASDNGVTKCRDYRFAGCNTCPCPTCGDRMCCSVANAQGSYDVLCVEDGCPLP